MRCSRKRFGFKIRVIPKLSRYFRKPEAFSRTPYVLKTAVSYVCYSMRCSRKRLGFQIRVPPKMSRCFQNIRPAPGDIANYCGRPNQDPPKKNPQAGHICPTVRACVSSVLLLPCPENRPGPTQPRPPQKGSADWTYLSNRPGV